LSTRKGSTEFATVNNSLQLSYNSSLEYYLFLVFFFFTFAINKFDEMRRRLYMYTYSWTLIRLILRLRL